MQLEVVTQPARLDEIGLDWDRLWRRGDNSVFQSHGWLKAWWSARIDGDGTRLHVGLCWSAGALVAVIACATRLHRRIRLLEWAGKDWTDYCDVLIDPDCGNPNDVLKATWRAIAQAGRFDATYLSHVRPDALVRRLTEQALSWPAALRLSSRAEQTLQVCCNGLSGQEWFRSLSKKARNNHTRGKRILGESGSVVVSVHEPGDPRTEAVLDRMIALKLEWLERSGRQSAVLENNGRILRSLYAELERHSAVRLFTITCGGDLVAGSVNITQRGQMGAFFAAFDPKFDRASPGTLVMVEYLMWAFDHQIPTVDFLCGEEEYKFKFANAQTELASFVGARTMIGLAALAISERTYKNRAARERAAAFAPARELELAS